MMANELDQKTVDTIKATIPVLEEHGTAITKRFYELMLQDHPELKNIFNESNQRDNSQPKALANTVYAAAVNIDNLEALLPAVNQIAEKHRSVNVKPEHYPIVGEYLLKGMKDVLGDAATDDILDAWEKYYGVLADVFISTEDSKYKEAENSDGGWEGFRDFRIVKKVVESDVITSFYLKPADGKAFPSYQPGQYITVKAEIDNDPYESLRQYSLSTAPGGDYYRISVKREDEAEGKPAGKVSNFLHGNAIEGETIPITVPAGDFILNQDDTRPLVLLAGGVGITPMMSMLETTLSKHPEREVIFIHSVRSSNVQAMMEHVQNLKEENPQLTTYTIYSDDADAPCDKHGRIDKDWLNAVLPTKDADFYFTGPAGFMSTVYGILQQIGVNDEDINFEVFGPDTAEVTANATA